MVVVQIYILAFPIDKKKSFTRLSSFYLVYTKDSFKMRFVLQMWLTEEPSWTWVSKMSMCPLKKKKVN